MHLKASKWRESNNFCTIFLGNLSGCSQIAISYHMRLPRLQTLRSINFLASYTCPSIEISNLRHCKQKMNSYRMIYRKFTTVYAMVSWAQSETKNHKRDLQLPRLLSEKARGPASRVKVSFQNWKDIYVSKMLNQHMKVLHGEFSHV